MFFVRGLKYLCNLSYGSAVFESRIYPGTTYIRKIFYHNSISSKTLLYRFINFFRQSPKYSRFIVKHSNGYTLWETCGLHDRRRFGDEKIRLSNSEFNIFCDTVNKLTFLELEQCLVSLSNKNNSKYLVDYKKIVNYLDKVCCERISSVSIEYGLRMNHCWLHLLGTNIVNLKSFAQSIEHFKNFLLDGKGFPQSNILILFYAGFARKDPTVKEIVNMVITRLCTKEILKELSNLEIIVAANVAFKTGTKISNPSFMDHLVGIMRQNLHTFITDPALFVTLIKSIRHNKYYDYSLLKDIEQSLTNDQKILLRYNFTVKVHLLALYADALYSEHDFMCYIINSITRNVLHSGSYRPYEENGKGTVTGKIRAKDISRLLWATSYLGFKLNPKTVEKIILPIILDKASNGVYEKQLELLIDSVLSLWIMGYKPLELLSYVFSKETIKYLSAKKRIRFNRRLELLFACISIEAPEMMKDISAETMPSMASTIVGEKDMLSCRPALLNVLQLVKSIAWRFDIVDVQCVPAIPHLNLPGILLKTNCNHNRNIYIEVLDESNCLYKTDIPTGLMLLKLRLLRHLGHQVILINYSEHKNNHSSLIDYIENEINKTR